MVKMASCGGSFKTITLLCLGSLLSSVTWYLIDEQSGLASHKPPAQRKSSPSVLCKGCRSRLSSSCRGFEKAIITQANTPVGTKIVYEAESTKTLREHPFSNKTFDTCAVVGNGGILMDSGCGKMIDSTRFVMRCNLPPLNKEYSKDVGFRTDLVTANPSIFNEKYNSLSGRRRGAMERLQSYGKSLILLPAFSFAMNTQVSLRVAYTLEDFGSPSHAVFFNPDYLRNLSQFWNTNGLKSRRLSTGVMMASLALEVCSNVHLYGFWPFSNHPHGLYALTNHYYDDTKAKRWFHAMPVEFDLLLKLHSQGVLRLHLGRCLTDKS
ncbi:alpha-2,8-sialyltransferase 8E-like isoform X4 [Festucalex cinctus]